MKRSTNSKRKTILILIKKVMGKIKSKKNLNKRSES